jgi:hypothetical protein
MAEKPPVVHINGKFIPPSDYEIKDGKITFLKPLIELAPNAKLDTKGKRVFQISVKFDSV